jgi:hypothetical protein
VNHQMSLWTILSSRNGSCPEIIQALEHAEVGIKTLKHISRLPPKKQVIELARRLEARKANAERQAVWRADPERGKAFFASQGYAEARAGRLRRISKRATGELKEAYEEGRLTLRAYDQPSRLSPFRQRKVVALDRDKEQALFLAAAAFRLVLANKPQRIDLAPIIGAIRSSCSN